MENNSVEALKELLKDGVLTQEEYDAKIKQIASENEPLVMPKTPDAETQKKIDYTAFRSVPTTQMQSATLKKKKNKQDPIIYRAFIVVAIILIAAFVTHNPLSEKSSEPVKFSSSLNEGDEVYAELTVIEPYYGVFRDNGNITQDYTDVVCKCTTTDNDTIWVVIPYETYIEKFDPSAVDTTLNRSKTTVSVPIGLLNGDSSEVEAPKVLNYSSGKKIFGEAEKAENIAEDIGNEVSPIVFEYFDYMN